MAEALSAADRHSAARLSALLLEHEEGQARFTVSGESSEPIDLPPALVTVLEAAAGMVAAGAGVTVLARDEDLTSEQAADMLNVSRQYMVGLLERGDIPSTKVGTHRRVRAYDLAAYRRRRDEERSVSLADMADQAQALGGYDKPAMFGPPRRG